MRVIKPVGARVLVKTIENKPKNVTESGLLLPDSQTQVLSPMFGEIVAMGDGLKASVSIGDTIYFAHCYGIDAKDPMQLVDEGAIYAVVGE